jgi:hypothetical protein
MIARKKVTRKGRVFALLGILGGIGLGVVSYVRAKSPNNS